ncbi:MAG: hypothetical protein JWO00_332 [Candidatus Parcubacteria bacterium]|nr:hypothetical protein [Candidatus Parcubacteria bacterium]
MKYKLLEPFVVIGSLLYGVLQISIYFCHCGGVLADISSWSGSLLIVGICCGVWCEKYRFHRNVPLEGLCPLSLFGTLTAILAVIVIVGIYVQEIGPIARFLHVAYGIGLVAIALAYFLAPHYFKKEEPE